MDDESEDFHTSDLLNRYMNSKDLEALKMLPQLIGLHCMIHCNSVL